MSCEEHLSVDRRRLLAGSAASLALWGFRPRALSAAPARDPRLLMVILRGGLDGLALAAPVGDPDYARLRGEIAVRSAGSGERAGLALDTLFALNPSMPTLHGLYQRKEALVVHAVATPYRGRSHFDGQDLLESGLPAVARADEGWLNRALSGMSNAGRIETKGLSIGAVVPLIMQGRAPILSWIPKVYGLELKAETVNRLLALYRETDPALAKALGDGLGLEAAAASVTSPKTAAAVAPPAVAAGQPRPFREFIETAEVAARYMAKPDGPRIGALSFSGWDTHANGGAIVGQLANRLAGLDAAIKAFHDTIRPAWRDTVVVIVTEFGRTARVNGTNGTDHGTGMAALLLGGAVNGGRVLADWPGLGPGALFEGRDLRPTRDLRAVLKGVLADHLGIPAGLLAQGVFPESGRVAPERDLLRSV